MAKIVCVEDEPDLRRDLVDELSDAGHHVIACSDIVSAQAAIARHDPDLVLCDIIMPGGSGYELLEAARAAGSTHMSFVFLSALAERQEVVRGKRLGADDYLVKPVDYDNLLATVDARIRQSSRSRADGEDDVTASTLRTLDSVGIGALAFNSKGEVLRANDIARKVCDAAVFPALRMHCGSIRIGTPLRQTLIRLLRDCRSCRNGEPQLIELERDLGCEPVLAQVECFAIKCEQGAAQAAGLLKFTRAEPGDRTCSDLIRKRYALTPAEFRLASDLMTGRSVKEVAFEQGVSEATIRTHLKALLGKTMTKRQGELIALLHNIALLDGVRIR